MRNEQLENAILSYRGEAVETLKRWVKQPSFQTEGAPWAPFGKDTRKMLDLALADCAALGFSTRNVDGYAGICDYGEGEDADALGILGHLDVVPVGPGWTHDPFGAEVVGNRIYGRGTSDDKGPMIASLYALAAVKKAGIPLNRKVRLIFGCDEEVGMESILRYKEKEVMPRSGFSPDADYPVINIEKGGCHVVLKGKLADDGLQIVSFDVGEQINVIPGTAAATVRGGSQTAQLAETCARTLGFALTAKALGDTVELTTTGKGGHAAMGEGTSNAIGQMLMILKAMGAKGVIEHLADTVGMHYYGEGLGIAMQDALSGKLTCSLDIIRTDAKTGEVKAYLDIRYPLMMGVDAMMHVMRMVLDGRLEAELASSRPPHFVSENSRLVKELLAAYEEVTGQKGKALAIGGGTYARAMEEGVAFGALFPGDEEMAHQPDEYLDLDRFYENMRIIAYAIVRLCGKE
ncbi:MAG: Sapep family Mn(2+)-dependent dipeptidase [Clostridia bacterium]|nr:Sapep family Mn(2+)-dependent dipeptidase [Clostridia bacterium]